MERGGADATGVRVFLATDVHVPETEMIARCLEWSTNSLALSPFMRSRYKPWSPRRTWRCCLRRLTSGITPGRPTSGSILLYCSVPDRGLYYLKDLFPAIRKRVQQCDARDYVSDFTLWGRAAAKDAFMRFFAASGRGRVSSDTSIDAGWSTNSVRARVLAYPCLFEEGFCIAAAECMAAGAVPVTTNAFALTTTVGDAGMLIEGRPRSWFYRRRFVNAVVNC